jgi:phosphomannomutase
MSAKGFDPTILREYDVRGIVGETLTADTARTLGLTFGTRLVQSGGRSVAVGYDGRLTSPDLAAALVDGLQSCGLAVRQVGMGPTPMLSFAIKHLPTDGGVMVTGSHNPPEYNGFKMTLQGAPFFGADIQGLAALAAAGDFAAGTGSFEEIDLREAYAARLAEEFQSTRMAPIAWDPGNGAAGEILNMLCATIPGHHHVINGIVDGTFPGHHPDPTVAENLAELQAHVLEHNCELGIAFDGDGDRIGAVDGQGRILWADQLMMLFAEDVLRGIVCAVGRGDERSHLFRRPVLRFRRWIICRGSVARLAGAPANQPGGALRPDAGDVQYAGSTLSQFRGPKIRRDR